MKGLLHKLDFFIYFFIIISLCDTIAQGFAGENNLGLWGKFPARGEMNGYESGVVISWPAFLAIPVATVGNTRVAVAGLVATALPLGAGTKGWLAKAPARPFATHGTGPVRQP